MWLEYEGESDLYGIRLSHFVVPPAVFADPNSDTEAGRDNRAFCTPSGSIADCKYLRGGVLNISACTASPAVAGIPSASVQNLASYFRCFLRNLKKYRLLSNLIDATRKGRIEYIRSGLLHFNLYKYTVQ